MVLHFTLNHYTDASGAGPVKSMKGNLNTHAVALLGEALPSIGFFDACPERSAFDDGSLDEPSVVI